MSPAALTAEDAVGVAAALLAALFVGYLGYRIRFRGDMELIAGYDPEAVADGADEEGIARLVGNLALGVAALTAVCGVATPFVSATAVLWGGYTLVVLGGIAVVSLRGRRYRRG